MGNALFDVHRAKNVYRVEANDFKMSLNFAPLFWLS